MKATHYTLEACFEYTADDGEPKLADWLDDVAVHLEELGAEDLFIVSDNTENTFTVSVLIPAQAGDTPENVIGKGMSLFRTAFHACDARTPGWPTPREAAVVCAVNLSVATIRDESAAEDKDPKVLAHA